MCEQLTDDQKTKRPRRNKGVIRAVHRACMQLLEVSRAAGSHLAKLFLGSASLWLPKAAGPEILAKRIREDKMDRPIHLRLTDFQQRSSVKNLLEDGGVKNRTYFRYSYISCV